MIEVRKTVKVHGTVAMDISRLIAVVIRFINSPYDNFNKEATLNDLSDILEDIDSHRVLNDDYNSAFRDVYEALCCDKVKIVGKGVEDEY